MNPVLIVTHNCLELTKRCVESALKQDVPTRVFVFDNGSTDGTQEWLLEQKLPALLSAHNAGVSAGWNRGLHWILEQLRADYCLVANNDTVLAPWTYSMLLEQKLPFVTGLSVGTLREIRQRPQPKPPVEAPDFSLFLIDREAWKTVGHFDEKLVFYCGDLDYHLRAWRKGLHVWNAGVPFYHRRSSTLSDAPPREKRLIELRADADRQAFTEKWGCAPSGPSYEAMFTPENFAVDAGGDLEQAS